MKFYTLLALAPLAAAQSVTPAPTTTADVWTGPPWATADPSKWSSIYASLVSEGKIPSTLTAPPWPTGSWGPGQGPPWGPGGPHGPGGRHWGGPSGLPPWGTNAAPWSAWSGWSTRSDWRAGPWTAWWDGSACPGADWPGWTAGPWSTAAPWTSWSACKAATTTETVLASGTGGIVTSTRVAVKVEAADATPTPGSASTAGGPRATTGVGAVGVVGAVMVGVLGGL